MTVAAVLEPGSRDSAGSLERELRAKLLPLVGQSLSQLRFSYGDELALHFGELTPVASKRLTGLFEGEYIFGCRGSRWQFRLDGGRTYISSDPDPENVAAGLLKPRTKQELKESPPVAFGSRVVDALPFINWHLNGWGLELLFSDGSALLTLPTPPGPPEQTPEGELLPEIADWELFMPNHLLLSAWRGPTWELKSSNTLTGSRVSVPAASPSPDLPLQVSPTAASEKRTAGRS